MLEMTMTEAERGENSRGVSSGLDVKEAWSKGRKASTEK